MTDKPAFVTADEAMGRKETRLTAADREVFSGAGAVEITAEMFAELTRAARATHATFTASISAAMTEARARRIKAWRCDEGLTWRGVAEAAFQDWGRAATWAPPSNQIAGLALCQQAAAQLGEDPNTAPWN